MDLDLDLDLGALMGRTRRPVISESLNAKSKVLPARAGGTLGPQRKSTTRGRSAFVGALPGDVVDDGGEDEEADDDDEDNDDDDDDDDAEDGNAVGGDEDDGAFSMAFVGGGSGDDGGCGGLGARSKGLFICLVWEAAVGTHLLWWFQSQASKSSNTVRVSSSEVPSFGSAPSM